MAGENDVQPGAALMELVGAHPQGVSQVLNLLYYHMPDKEREPEAYAVQSGVTRLLHVGYVRATV